MEFRNETELALFIKKLGGDLWLVGGFVRDTLLNKDPSDKDYMITGVDIKYIPFNKVVGADFPVFLVSINNEVCEIALARTERSIGLSRTDFEIKTCESITVEEDLSRRDFTINSMAIHVLSGKLVDPFDGKSDLDDKLLRHTSQAFIEDPLRIYRAARFASKFEFTIHKDTKKLIYSIKDKLVHLPGERVFLELQKVLSLDKPSRFFSELFDIGVLDLHFQEISNLNVPDKHDGTALNHTLTVMDYGETPLERFCLLVHDLGKGLTPKESHPSHYKHDSLGIEPIESLCERIKIPNLYKKYGIMCAKFHMKMKNLPVMRKGKALRFILDLGDDFDLVKNVSYIDSAYREGSDLEKESFLFKEITKLSVEALKIEKEVTGKLLIEEGYTPSKQFGEILFQRRVYKFRGIKC